MFSQTVLRRATLKLTGGCNTIPSPLFRSSFRPSTRQLSTSSLADGDLTGQKGRFDLTGKNYIVTGGGRGIGYAAARAIAEYGGNICVFDAAPAPVKDFANLEREFGIKTKYVRTDVTDEKSLNAAFEETVAEFATIDGW